MLVVLEQTLSSCTPCAFEADAAGSTIPLHGSPRPMVAREVYLPIRPVRLPQTRRLDDAQALTQARAEVARALDDICVAEAALERQLAELRGLIENRQQSMAV